jgi:hypothetical protein
MSTLFRIISVGGVAILSGILVWIAFLVLLSLWTPTDALFLNPGTPGDLYECIRVGVMVGAPHGAIVAISIFIGKPKSIFRTLIYGLAGTELCLLVVSTWWVLHAWPPSSSPQDIVSWSAIFFLIGSAAFFLQTLVIGSLAWKTQRLVLPQFN